MKFSPHTLADLCKKVRNKGSGSCPKLADKMHDSQDPDPAQNLVPLTIYPRESAVRWCCHKGGELAADYGKLIQLLVGKSYPTRLMRGVQAIPSPNRGGGGLSTKKGGIKEATLGFGR